MSKSDETAIAIVPATLADTGIQLVRAGSPLAAALDTQGVNVDAPASQRAVAKAVTSLAKDLMEGAMYLAADSGHEGAKRAQACLVRVRAERALRK